MDLVAIKTIVNEFPAYGKLSEYIAQGTISVIHLNSSIKFELTSSQRYFIFVSALINELLRPLTETSWNHRYICIVWICKSRLYWSSNRYALRHGSRSKIRLCKSCLSSFYCRQHGQFYERLRCWLVILFWFIFKISTDAGRYIIRYKVPLFQPSQKYRLPVNHQRPVSCQT